MYTRKELVKKFIYEKVKQLVEEDENYSSIENIVTFRTESSGRKVNEFVEEVREKIIDGIIEEKKKGKEIRNIEGFARTIVSRRIQDKIDSDKDERKYKARLNYIQNGYGILKGKTQRYKKVVNEPQVITADFRLKQIVNKCLNNLSDDQQKVLTMYYYDEKTIDEIAEVMGIKEKTKVYSIKHEALGKLRAVFKERLGSETEDIGGRLHDISILEKIVVAHPEIFVEPPEGTVESSEDTVGPTPPIHNQKLSEEAKKYMDMGSFS